MECHVVTKIIVYISLICKGIYGMLLNIKGCFRSKQNDTVVKNEEFYSAYYLWLSLYGRITTNLKISGNSLAVQWLGLGAFTAGVQVQSLIRELRSRKPHHVAKKKKKKKNFSLFFILCNKRILFCKGNKN